MNRYKRWLGAMIAVIAAALTTHAQDFLMQWNFDNGDLSGMTGDQPLQYIGTEGATSFVEVTIDGETANAMQFPKTTPQEGYLMPVPTTTNPVGSFTVNTWSIIMDVMFPADSSGKKRALLELVEPSILPGTEDAEFYINAANQLGTSDLSGGSVQPGAWHRIIISVDFEGGEVTGYIDGEPAFSQPINEVADNHRWALDPTTNAKLFNDDNDEAEAGFVSDIQLRDVPLTQGQAFAFGGASAAGIPEEIPAIPSFVERWTPAKPIANRDTDVGVVINEGNASVDMGSIVFSLDGTSLDNANVSTSGSLITIIATPSAPFAPATTHTMEVAYTDDKDGAKTFSRTFEAAIFYEDFDSVELGPNVDEGVQGDEVWSKTPPSGWTIDDSNMPDLNDPVNGVTEWKGWSFADPKWWSVVDSSIQRRDEFTKASGATAIADPDEWDDKGDPEALGPYESYLISPEISLAGIPGGAAFIQFDSSWRPESDNYNQTANLTASFDGGEPVELLLWDSQGASATFHPDAPNETVILSLKNPEGAQTVQLTFGLFNAGNDWWWAFDNLVVNAGTQPPSISSQPATPLIGVVGGSGDFSVVSEGGGSLAYQWSYSPDGANYEEIPGATMAELTLNNLSLDDAGFYKVLVSNEAGSEESVAAQLFVNEPFGGSVTDDLVAYLNFDGDANDSSGSGNDGAPVGDVSYVDGAIGQALRYSTTEVTDAGGVVTGANYNYVTLGSPADLNFGTDTDFSISFWTSFTDWSGDPSFISNKDWGSGGNAGWIIAADGNGKMQWNIGPTRADYDDDGTAVPLNGGDWHHVVVSFDRDAAATAYIDGREVKATPIGNADRDVNTPNGQATNIGQDGTGAYTDGLGVFMRDGTIDEVGIWRRAITAEEVDAIYKSGLAGTGLNDVIVEDELVIGQWDFDNGNLSATVGPDLEYRDGSTEAGTSFGTTTSFGIPDIDGEAANVMNFPANDGPMGYLMTVEKPGGVGDKLNQYTLIFDILYPASSSDQWRGLIQIDDLSNGNDGDLFVNTGNGIGISGNYSGTVLPDTWHRIAFVIDNVANQIIKYIDGVQVGSQGADDIDGRWGLQEQAILLVDESGEVQPGYVNSIQLRGKALTREDLAALGGASAAGIPESIPEGVEPPPEIVLTSDFEAYVGESFTLSADPGPYDYQWFKGAGADRAAIEGATDPQLTFGGLSFEDSGTYSVTVSNSGGQSISNNTMLYVVPQPGPTLLFSEDFESVVLGPNVDEEVVDDTAFTHEPPQGWTVENFIPGLDEPGIGVEEWKGWSFADVNFWNQVDGQRRGEFTRAEGVAAIADGDEWDDLGDPDSLGFMNTYIRTPDISLEGVVPGSAVVHFDSSWRPENDQTALVMVSFDGGPEEVVLRFDADHPDNVNEPVGVNVDNPDGASSMKLIFAYVNAKNNWWWAIDNIRLTGWLVPLLEENFDGLTLGPNVDEEVVDETAFTHEPPLGWSIENDLPGLDQPGVGVEEWKGWSFADFEFWISVDPSVQRRDEFTKASGILAIADGDEWDDLGDPESLGSMNTFLSTPPIPLTEDIAPNTAILIFDSSWRPDAPQKAVITVSYDGGEPMEVLRWTSESSDPNFHDDNSTNETVVVELNNPEGATTLQITFAYIDALNDWWWAIDNLRLSVNDVSARNQVVIPTGPELSVSFDAGIINLSWLDAEATLEWAPDVTGPWTALDGVESPHSESVTEMAMKYFRLVK